MNLYRPRFLGYRIEPYATLARDRPIHTYRAWWHWLSCYPDQHLAYHGS